MALSRPDSWESRYNPVPGDVLACLEELEVPVLRVVDDEAIALCPYHYGGASFDRHPSWSMRVEDFVRNDGSVVLAGTMNCFSCGYRGNMATLAKDLLGLSYHAANEWVRARGGRARARLVLERRNKPGPVDTTTQINEASLALSGPAPAWALEKRGFSQEAADHYEMGWDAKEGCWVAPIRNKHGALLGWQNKWDDGSGRVLNHPRSVPKSETLFGYQQLLASGADTAVLMEPPLDVVRFYEAGFEGGVASYGSGVSDEQIRLVACAPGIKTVVLALDQDKAGQKGTNKIIDSWATATVRFRILNYGGTSAKAVGDMTEAEIEYAVRTSIPWAIYRR